MMKKIIALLLVAASLCMMFACGKKTDDNGAVSNELKMKVFKMGRASCTIFRIADKTVMIDTGDEEKYDKIVEYMLEKGISHIDTLIITSLSKKNIGGISAILGAATVSDVYVPDYTKSSGTYLTFANALSSAGITPKQVSENTTLKISELELALYPATKEYPSAVDIEDEARSIVIEAKHGATLMLLTSKIAGERLADVAEMLKDKEYSLVTVPNYGIYDSNLKKLFGAIKTEYAVVVTSSTNPLPTETEAVLKDCGLDMAKLFNTVNGSIEVSSLGRGISEIKN